MNRRASARSRLHSFLMDGRNLMVVGRYRKGRRDDDRTRGGVWRWIDVKLGMPNFQVREGHECGNQTLAWTCAPRVKKNKISSNMG